MLFPTQGVSPRATSNICVRSRRRGQIAQLCNGSLHNYPGAKTSLFKSLHLKLPLAFCDQWPRTKEFLPFLHEPSDCGQFAVPSRNGDPLKKASFSLRSDTNSDLAPEGEQRDPKQIRITFHAVRLVGVVERKECPRPHSATSFHVLEVGFFLSNRPRLLWICAVSAKSLFPYFSFKVDIPGLNPTSEADFRCC